MCVVSFPWFDSNLNCSDWGVTCKSCRVHVPVKEDVEEALYEARHEGTLYSADGFVEHFRSCEQAIKAFHELRDKINGESIHV